MQSERAGLRIRSFFLDAEFAHGRGIRPRVCHNWRRYCPQRSTAIQGGSMEDETRSSAARAALPVILMAAVVQGWVLYGLHHAVKEHHWQATDQAWLIALYALAVFIPVTLQLLAEHA